jgi:hypothetical protein
VTRRAQPGQVRGRGREPVEGARAAALAELRAVRQEERVRVGRDRGEVDARPRRGEGRRQVGIPRLAGRRQARRLAFHPQHVRLDARGVVVASDLNDVVARSPVGNRHDRLVLRGPERGNAQDGPPGEEREVVQRLGREGIVEVGDGNATVPEHRGLERRRSARRDQRGGALPSVDDEVVVLGQVAQPDRGPRARGRRDIDAEEVGVRSARQVRDVELPGPE